jgi:EAL and modified HD-GYP domain-containing signal transduction protein
METFIARQPIFNFNRRLFAYELLYRGSDTLEKSQVSGNQATSALLSSTFFTEGLDKISNNKPCFVNFTEDLLVGKLVHTFPKNKVFVEVLEDVRPTTAVIDACKKLKEAGYVLALDDFIYDQNLLPLIELADIIKFDFQTTSADALGKALHDLSKFDIEFLAEKVESMEEFERGIKLGFSYFQGYFFARPETIKIKELAANKINLLRLLSQVNQESISNEKMTELISSDVALSYKLLRYINSSYFYRISKIESIQHAIAFLGEKEIRRFVTLITISEIATDKPTELVRLALSRAKFCELLAIASTLQSEPEEIFLLGLFSLMDAMLDTTIAHAVATLPLDDMVKQALTLRQGPLASYLEAVISYERQERDRCLSAITQLGVKKETIYSMYIESLEFADKFTSMI